MEFTCREALLPVCRSPYRQCFLINGDECSDERLGIPDHHHIGHERVASHAILEERRGDVLPCRCDEDLLLSAGDRQETLMVEDTNVTRTEPIVHERCTRCVVVVPVSREHVASLDQNFAIFSDADRTALDRQANRADTNRIWPVHGCRGCDLRQSVSLQCDDTNASEEVAKPCTEGRTTRNRVCALSTEEGTDPRIDDLVECCVNDLRSDCDLPTLDPLRVCNGRLRCLVKDSSLTAGFGLRFGAVVDLLEDPWHGEHPRRFHHWKLVE